MTWSATAGTTYRIRLGGNQGATGTGTLTLSGNVAQNAGGPHCLKYGVTTNHVVALDVLLPDGSDATLGSPQGEPWGPDLVGLFVGSEGMFGVAVAVTVRLEPVPREIRTIFADFLALRAASEAVSAIIASGIVPAALEMMDQSCVRAVEASIYATGARTDAAAVLLVEVDGSPEAAAAESAIVERLGSRASPTPLPGFPAWTCVTRRWGCTPACLAFVWKA